MAWQKEGTNTLTVSGDILDITTVTKKFLQKMEHHIDSGAIDTGMTFNADTGSNYATRRSIDGASDATALNQPTIQTEVGSGNASEYFSIQYIINVAAEEKPGINFSIKQLVIGAATAPSRHEVYYKWANTSDLIDQVTQTNAGAGSYDIDSNMSILGTD